MTKLLSIERAGRALIVSLALSLVSSAAHAQAWTPKKHDLTLALSYQALTADKHLFSEAVTPSGSRALDLGTIHSNAYFLSGEYGIVDRFAVTADVAVVDARYVGTDPEDPSLDDGSYHGGLQNASITLRYEAVSRPFVVTPFLGYTFPTRDYPTLGHASIGGDVSDTTAGVFLGRRLSPFLPDAYLHGSYSHSWIERVHGAPRASNDAWGIEGGYFIGDLVALRAYGSWLRTNGGLDWFHDLNAANFHAHDAASAASYTQVGGGAIFTASRTVDVYVSYNAIIHGENTHNGRSLTVSTAWRPSGGR